MIKEVISNKTYWMQSVILKGNYITLNRFKRLNMNMVNQRNSSDESIDCRLKELKKKRLEMHKVENKTILEYIKQIKLLSELTIYWK